MDHIKCAGCGQTVSVREKKCPACSSPLSSGSDKSNSDNWSKIYIALVLFLNIAVIFLVVTGERRRVFWLGIAVMALASFLLAKLKVRRPH